MTQVLGYHPSYLPQFTKMHNFLMRGNGPLPLHIRNYLAILVNLPTPLSLSSLPPPSLPPFFQSLSSLFPPINAVSLLLQAASRHKCAYLVRITLFSGEITCHKILQQHISHTYTHGVGFYSMISILPKRAFTTYIPRQSISAGV